MTISGYRTLEPRINRRAETHIWPDFSFLRVSLTVQPSQRCRKLYIYHASSFLFCAALVRSFVVQRAVNFVASRLFMHCARSPGWVEKKRPTKSAKKKNRTQNKTKISASQETCHFHRTLWKRIGGRYQKQSARGVLFRLWEAPISQVERGEHNVSLRTFVIEARFALCVTHASPVHAPVS